MGAYLDRLGDGHDRGGGLLDGGRRLRLDGRWRFDHWGRILDRGRRGFLRSRVVDFVLFDLVKGLAISWGLLFLNNLCGWLVFCH